ncbi:MAG TPA: alginate export family protein [Candidatus Polarisedimenticolia bacterium]
MTKRRIGTCALALLSASVVARSVPAEAQEEKKDVTWSLSGEARYRPEWRENTDLDSTREDQTRQGYMRLRLGVSILYKEDYRVFVQVQDARVAGEETSTGSNDKNLDLHQGYLEMKHLAGDRWNLIVGRQEWKYGDERLIGASWWSNVGRSFDGVKVRFAGHSYWIDGIAARIQTRPGPFGSPPVPATTGSDLFGLYGQCFARKGAEYEAYWLQYDDHVAKVGETGALGDSAIRAYGVRGKDHFGPVDVTVEGTLERGTLFGDDLRAGAAAAVAGYTIGSRAKIRLFGGYDYATGDRNPTDGKQEEFFNFFPTNHALYGYIDYQGWRNLRGPWGAVGLTAGRHYAQVKYHRFQLDQARDSWKDEAGVTVLGSDPTGQSGTSLGRELDLTWRFAWKEKTSFEAGYARFMPDRFARLTRGDDASDWAYVMLTATF